MSKILTLKTGFVCIDIILKEKQTVCFHGPAFCSLNNYLISFYLHCEERLHMYVNVFILAKVQLPFYLKISFYLKIFKRFT